MPSETCQESRLADVPSVALFGPEVTDWTAQSLQELQSALAQDAGLGFLCQALAQLPEHFRTLTLPDGDQQPPVWPAAESLQQLSDFAAGKASLQPEALTNIHLAPLTVVSHAVQLVRGDRRLGRAGAQHHMRTAAGRAGRRGSGCRGRPAGAGGPRDGRVGALED
jgi:hypothetical protein